MVLTFVASLLLSQAQSAEPARFEQALQILKKSPVFDGHNDLPWAIRMVGFDKSRLDRVNTTFQTDLLRLHKGGVGAQFWSVWIPTKLSPKAAVKTVHEQIATVKKMISKYPDQLELAVTSTQVRDAMARGKVASLIGMEGGHSINSSLDELRKLYRSGARYMTLTHSKNTQWADSATDKVAHHGINSLGEKIVKEMNRLGMLVDLSHVSADTMRDTLRIAKSPVIFSHSGVRGICNHVRNVPDDVLPLVKKNNGVIMVIFIKEYASEEHRIWYAAREKFMDALSGSAKSREQRTNQWDFKHPEPIVTIQMVADHIDYIKQHIGVDHIGIGSDFDGGGGFEGLHDVSCFPALIVELLKRGYTEVEIAKITNGNILRVLQENEAVSQRMQVTSRRIQE